MKRKFKSCAACFGGDSIKSPVTWMGNKTPILNILYALFPLHYERYIEPFGGSASVLLGKAMPDKFEVFNDYNRNLVNLFRCMRDRPVEFIRALGFLNLNARDDFNVIKKFFRKEDFDDAYFRRQLQLSEVILPPIEAKEIRALYAAAREDYDLRRAVMYHLGGALQFYADGKKIVIEQLEDEEADVSCEGDCENCPLLFHCSEHCDRCPCTVYCDRCEKTEPHPHSTLEMFLDNLSRKEQHDALIHLTLRWAERQKKEKLEDKE